ncbi:MAG TPA: ProQ/FinO family protein [Burkholderiaceae bacterium]
MAAAAAAPRPASELSPAACAAELKQRFPALFSGAPKPLKLRIQVDIQQRAPGVFTKNALSAFFRRYTGSTSYLIAVSKAAQRVDLDGQPAGELSAEHRQIALDELARRRGNQESRRELEEQQRRNRAGLLRDFETTTLTRANFCALKGVAVEELDGLLEIARGEAAERARMQPPAFDPRRQQRPPERPQGHPQQRPPQRSGAPSGGGGQRPPRPPRPR